MKEKKELIILIVALLLIVSLNINLVNAEFTFDKNSSSIEKSYAEGDYVRGRINMSFTEQENKNFMSNFNGGIGLYDLLNNSGLSFACNPKNCKDTYNAESGAATKSFSAVNNKLFGFVVSGGTLDKIDGFRFNITDSTGQSSCNNQINVDLFNDGTIDFYNTKSSGEVCGSKGYGCFESDEIKVDADISKTLYCNKVNVSAAGGYRITANVKKISPNGEKLKLYFYDLTARKKMDAPCEIDPGSQAVGESKELTCDVKYSSLKPFQAQTCVQDSKTYENGETGYRIKTESHEACGGTITDSNPYSIVISSDYDLAIQPLQYAPVGEIEFNPIIYKNLNASKDLKNDVINYLNKVYGLDCKDNCVIPVSINGSSSNIQMHSAVISYIKKDQNKLTTEDIYDLTKKPFTMTMNSTFLNVEKMKFLVPNINGTHAFYLCFDQTECNGDNDLMSESVNVKVGFDFSMGPRSILVGQKTIFVAQSSKNITSSIWKFGDNSTAVNSNDNKAEHIYEKEGEFLVEVTATAKSGESSIKKFKVNVGDAKKSANLTINKYKRRVVDVTNDLKDLSEWEKNKIEADFTITADEFKKISNDYQNLGSSASNSDYVAIVGRLLDLKIPYEIKTTEKGSFPMAIGFNNLNPSYVNEISGDEPVDEDALKQSIISWMGKNYDSDIEFESISALYDEGKVELLTKYKADLLMKTSAERKESYLFIGYPSNSIKLKKSYDEKSIKDESAIYIPIDAEGKPDSIEFLIQGENLPGVEELGMFISPEIRDLNLGGEDKPISPDPWVREGKILWDRLLIVLGILIISVLAVYLFLQHWYKKNYERHLFKNHDDLYNLTNFIYNSRKIGLNDQDSRKKLEEKGWKGEQLTYAFKKIDGKRTGMFEIPIFKSLENKKVKQEIEKRQKKPLDARFIKI